MVDDNCDKTICAGCLSDNPPALGEPDIIDRWQSPGVMIPSQRVPIVDEDMPIWHVFVFIVFFMLAISNIAGLVLIWSIAMVATGWHAIWCLVRNLEDGAP